MKTLITHINPHLDDIFAIWLFKRFNPEFKNANLEFISASRDAAKDESEDKVYFGTGGGRFDEHKESLKGECAGSLVWQEVSSKLGGDLEKKALEEMVEWNKLIDTGKAPIHEFSSFSLSAFIRSQDSLQKLSQRSVELGEEILDRILELLIKKKLSLKDWEDRVEFESKFGKSFAVISETIDRSFCKETGGDLFLMYDPKHKSVQFFTPNDIDLEPIYKKVKDLDPDADWFLHQSHHMVIAGSDSAPDSKKTKLGFEELVEVIKTV